MEKDEERANSKAKIIAASVRAPSLKGKKYMVAKPVVRAPEVT